MIGPFTTVPGGFTHVLVAIDKFTKWIEYKPIAKLTPDRVVDFISDILHHFGFPNTIITDLGSNFMANQFWEFCENACIEVKYVSVAHPWANGQVERVNGLIINGLKKRLYDENTKKGANGYMSYHMSSGSFGLSRPKPQDKRLSSSYMDLRLSYRPISCGNPQGLKCTTKVRWTW
jgi:transposase InsO family protein